MILFENITNNRITRIIIGKPSSMDVSCIIENNEQDAFSGEQITEQDIDDGLVFIENIGYIKILTLQNLGYVGLSVESLTDPIYTENLW